MRKNKGIAMALVALCAAALLVSACGSGNVSKGDVPDWFLNPPKAKDKLYGVGASEKAASIQLGKSAADQQARIDLANKIQVNVQNMMRAYLQQSGTMETARALQFSESVSKQLVNVKLTGSEIERSEFRDGRCFSLASVSMDTMKNALLSAVRDAAAEYSELKAQKAFDGLDKAIQNKDFSEGK
ncbi:MAG: LPP20 family lipoprotein [Candidatus Latescibacterota bacterium]